MISGKANSSAAPIGRAGGIELDYEKMYERISSMACIGVWEYDLLKHELWWTDAVYDLFELPRGTPLNRGMIIQCYSAKCRDEVERLRSRAIATGESFDVDIDIHTFRGNPRWIHLTADVECEDGVPVRLYGTQQDVTERRNAQEQVRKLQAELVHTSGRNGMSSMAAALAHELNQPLAAIVNYVTGVDRLLKPIAVPETAVAGIKEIKANALRAGEIIRAMRSMAERGRSRAECFDLTQLLRDAVSAACAAGSETSYKLQLQHTAGVIGDPVQVMQVASNLLRNAREALEGSEEPAITLRTHDDGPFVIVRIGDNGPGLPDGLKLFDPTVSSKDDGMGIGLSICRTIVEAGGGKIWVEPAPKGATICFSIPRDEMG